MSETGPPPLESSPSGPLGDAGAPQPKRGFVATTKDRINSGVAATMERLEAARPRSRTVDAAFRSLQRDTETGGGVLAAAVAFRVFLFMIPMVFEIVLVFGVADTVSHTPAGTMARRAGIAGIVAKAVEGANGLSGGQRVIAGLVAFVALVITARTLLQALRIVHGLVWRVPYPRRKPGPKAVLLFVGAVVLALSLEVGGLWLRRQTPIGGLVVLGLIAAVYGALWIVLASFLPRPKGLPWTALLPGGFVVGVGLLMLKLFTVLYVANAISRKSETYGAIGAALTILLWAYFFGRVLTAGAVVSATWWYRNRLPEPSADHAVDPFG